MFSAPHIGNYCALKSISAIMQRKDAIQQNSCPTTTIILSALKQVMTAAKIRISLPPPGLGK